MAGKTPGLRIKVPEARKKASPYRWTPERTGLLYELMRREPAMPRSEIAEELNKQFPSEQGKPEASSWIVNTKIRNDKRAALARAKQDLENRTGMAARRIEKRPSLAATRQTTPLLGVRP